MNVHLLQSVMGSECRDGGTQDGRCRHDLHEGTQTWGVDMGDRAQARPSGTHRPPASDHGTWEGTKGSRINNERIRESKEQGLKKINIGFPQTKMAISRT